MSQLIDTLIGLDPAGDGVVLLCTLTAGLLAALIALGFVVMRPTEPSRRTSARRLTGLPADLDLLGLWRLHRSLRKDPSAHPGGQRAGGPTRTLS